MRRQPSSSSSEKRSLSFSPRQSRQQGRLIVTFVQPRLWWIYGIFFGFWILKTLFLHHAISSVDNFASSSSSASSATGKKKKNGRTIEQLERNHAIPPSPLLWKQNASQQVEKKDKRGNILHRSITKLTAKDILPGLLDDKKKSRGVDGTTTTTSLTIEQASQGRERFIELLHDAGVTDMEPEVIAQLPLWKQVAQLYYYDHDEDNDLTDAGPVIVGLETCPHFRKVTPSFDLSVGVAGLFNTGTNPAAMYLAANCYIANNTSDKAGHGMRWQVPWGKHMIASRKWNNTAGHEEKTNKTNVLPVVLVRDPWTWMQSMCKNAYGVKWEHTRDICPNLTDSTVTINYPGQPSRWNSLVHLWSDWYNQYYHADYPRLMVRFEDFIFRPKEVLNEICTCAGASPKSDTFSYVVDSGKWGSAHHSSNMITAMIKYGSPQKRLQSFTQQDLDYAARYLDKNLLRLFQYHLPNKNNKR